MNDLKEWDKREASECHLADIPLDLPKREMLWKTQAPEEEMPHIDTDLSMHQQAQVRDITHSTGRVTYRPAGDSSLSISPQLDKGLLPSSSNKEKTAFTTSQGLLQFRAMPFGLYGVAAAFQRLATQVLAQCQGFVLTYIDDIIAFSPSWETHLCHLEEVLRALAKARLKTNPQKSKLKKLKYLGYLEGNHLKGNNSGTKSSPHDQETNKMVWGPHCLLYPIYSLLHHPDKHIV